MGEFMGSYRMPLKEAIMGTDKEATWHELSDKAGKISFSTFYIPNEQPPKEESRGQETPQFEKVVEPLTDTKEVEQIHSDEEDRKKETNAESLESKDSKPELTKEQKENDHKISVIKDDISDNEKVKESNAPQDEQNLDVKDASRRESDYKPDSSVSEDEKKDKKETKKLRRESTESSSDDKSVSSSSEGDAEKEKND